MSCERMHDIESSKYKRADRDAIALRIAGKTLPVCLSARSLSLSLSASINRNKKRKIKKMRKKN